jgi:RNA recognition motif. (a.k.a. RRM, RBD, or RNP domain)
VVLSERIDISIDPFTGRNPSYCFVELKTKEQAEQATQKLDGRDFLGRPVKIRLGVSKSPIDGSPHTESPFAFNRWQRDDASAHFKGYSEQGRRLYVGGLPKLSNQSYIDTEIRKLFTGFSVCVAHPPSEFLISQVSLSHNLQ